MSKEYNIGIYIRTVAGIAIVAVVLAIFFLVLILPIFTFGYIIGIG